MLRHPERHECPHWVAKSKWRALGLRGPKDGGWVRPRVKGETLRPRDPREPPSLRIDDINKVVSLGVSVSVSLGIRPAPKGSDPAHEKYAPPQPLRHFTSSRLPSIPLSCPGLVSSDVPLTRLVKKALSTGQACFDERPD